MSKWLYEYSILVLVMGTIISSALLRVGLIILYLCNIYHYYSICISIKHVHILVLYL